MQAKIRIEENSSVYEINAKLIADNKAKKQAKNVDPKITAYSIVYGEIFDEAIASPHILEAWVRDSMNWLNIKENAKLISGLKKESIDCKKALISYLPDQTAKKEV